jgi:hypothetical protein
LNDPTKQDDKPCLPYALTLAAMQRLAATYRAKQSQKDDKSVRAASLFGTDHEKHLVGFHTLNGCELDRYFGRIYRFF